MSYQIKKHECEGTTTSISVSKHPDGEWWLDKTVGMNFHLHIKFCPFCGLELVNNE